MASKSTVAVLQWVVVLVVGILVVAVVLSLNLIPRLTDGQKVLNAAKPAFTQQRIEGDVGGINIISQLVDTSKGIVTHSGGGAAEVPTVVAYVAHQQHISDAAALALLQKRFPHTTALLQAIPLSSVTEELPRLLSFLEKALKVTPTQLTSALSTNFPAITQAVTALPIVTGGWSQTPGVSGTLTRFNGAPVNGVQDIRDYFKQDVIPRVAAEKSNFDSIDGTSSINWIAPLLLIVGILVILFALLMIVRARGGQSPVEAMAGAGVVIVVGIVTVALVLGLSLVSRTSNAQKLINGLQPVFAAQRIQGDGPAIKMVDTITNDLVNPIVDTQGGAAGEVPKLVGFVSQKTGLSPTAVLGALQTHFPHVTALLEAIPLTSVSAELPSLLGFLTPNVVPHIPALVPTVVGAPAVTGGWRHVPGVAGILTRFAGTPVSSTPQVSNYFQDDVVPMLAAQEKNFHELASTSSLVFVGPLVLVVGVVVIVYGLLMLLIARGTAPLGSARPGRRRAAA
jgi:hypothetical protein